MVCGVWCTNVWCTMVCYGTWYTMVYYAKVCGVLCCTMLWCVVYYAVLCRGVLCTMLYYAVMCGVNLGVLCCGVGGGGGRGHDTMSRVLCFARGRFLQFPARTISTTKIMVVSYVYVSADLYCAEIPRKTASDGLLVLGVAVRCPTRNDMKRLYFWTMKTF